MLASASRSRPGPRARARAGFRSSKAGAARTLVKRDASSADRNDNDIDDENEHNLTMPRTTHVVCMSFDTLVDATDEMCLVGHEAARRFWPKKIPGTPAEYADVFRMLMPCLEESSSFEGALMVRVMAEENIAERTRFRLMLKRRKAERLKAEAAERAAMERAVTAKQRERFELEATRRAAELAARREEYKREMDRMTAGRTTRPLNLREVVAAWDEIKLHASMKFGCDLQTDVGWEGLTVQPAGLQRVVNEVREAFGDGTVTLSRDDTADDDEEDDEEEELERVGDGMEEARHDGVGDDVHDDEADDDGSTPKRRWLASHRLHHGAAEFLEACANEGHEVLVLGGPYRSAACVRTVLTHLGVRVDQTDDGSNDKGSNARAETNAKTNSTNGPLVGRVRVVGAEEGTARGLVVGAVMREREMPWQRWHLIDSSLSELERVARSELTVGFKARYASWVPALHKDKVRAEHAAGVEFIDYDGLFGIVGLETPSSVLDSR